MTLKKNVGFHVIMYPFVAGQVMHSVSDQLRALRRAAPKPARIRPGARPTYLSDEGLP